MHFFVGVIIPNPDNIQNDVMTLLAPYDENDNNNEETHWDWWVIGGRWDGVFFDNKKNKIDPYIHAIEGNVVKISEYFELEGIDDKLRESINKMLNKSFPLPYAIVSEAEGWVEPDEYLERNKKWEKTALEILKRHNGEYLVCVDCHV